MAISELNNLLYRRYCRERNLEKFLRFDAPEFLIKRQKRMVELVKKELKCMNINDIDFKRYCEINYAELLFSDIESDVRQTCKKWLEFCSNDPSIEELQGVLSCSVDGGECSKSCSNYEVV